MSIIGFACAEQSLERIIARDDESGEVDEELSSNVEEDEEEIDGGDAEESVHLRDGGLLLKIVQRRVFGKLRRSNVSMSKNQVLESFPQLSVVCRAVHGSVKGKYRVTNLLINLTNLMLGPFLERHVEI